jgi:hypothetical protein
MAPFPAITDWIRAAIARSEAFIICGSTLPPHLVVTNQSRRCGAKKNKMFFY